MNFKMIVVALIGLILGTACAPTETGVFVDGDAGADADGAGGAGGDGLSDASTSTPVPAVDTCLSCCDIFHDPNRIGEIPVCNGEVDVGENYLLK